MNRIHIIGRLGVIMTALAGSLLAFLAGPGPAAFATSLGGAPHGRPGLTYGQPALASLPPRPPGWNKHPPLPVHAHALVTGGMPGWQIALIAAGAALLAAALAVIAYRARTTRRRVTVSAA
jgi:hypothetical protein